MIPTCEHQRQKMVQSQLMTRGVDDARVLQAMNSVPREAFVPSELRDEAYWDRPLSIGQGQTISQPFTVAWMAAALQLDGAEKVLEIGTGSGYGAAVLSLLAAEVHTIERIPQLAQRARKVLAELGYKTVHVHEGDGTLGLPNEQPFDAICVTAAAAEFPAALGEQLAEGGRLVIPIGPFPGIQEMMRYTKRRGQLKGETMGSFAFVPLVRG